MASWTAPTTRSSGDLITASNWNTDITENLKYLKDAPTLTGALTLSAGQIVFPASQNASANANTLDDYEEGTWTPVIGGVTSETGQSYTYQKGTYVKVGKLVMAACRVTLSNKGTITGAVVVKGLPFASESSLSDHIYAATVSYWANLGTGSVSVGGFLRGNGTTQIEINNATAATATVTAMAAGDVSNSTTLVLSVVYVANA